MSRAASINLLLLAALPAAMAFAQTRPAQAPLVPVEQTVGDLSPLTTSLRIAPTDLRTPMEFDRVYRVPGASRGVGLPPALSPSGGQDGSRLARVSGAITAVFPASDYAQTKKSGLVPVVPPGTVFYIGPIPAAPPPRAARRISPFAVDTLAVFGADTRSVPGPIVWEAELKAAPTPKPSPIARRHLHVMTDEQYRRDRVRRVLGLGRR